MGYEIHGEKGYVDDGPSITGLRQFRNAVVRRRKTVHLPQIEHFLEHGYAPKPRILARECRELLPMIRNKDVRVTAEELAKAAMKAGRIVILSDGIS